jgi:nucleoid-associated protein YgaU
LSARWRLLAWSAALVLGLRALHALGAGTLSMPVTSAEDLAAWLDHAPPELMALAIVRLVALATGWYLAVCTLALALTRPFGRTRLVAAAARATPAIVRRVATGSGSLGLAAGTLLGALPSATATTTLAPTPAAASLLEPAQDPGPATATMTRGPHDTPAAVMTRLPAEDASRAARAAPAGPAAPAPEPGPGTSAVPTVSWTVEAGDSFWSIAAEIVAPTGATPSDREMIGYWRRLVEANGSRLLDPGNPDLLVPGQELVVPDPVK